jgi:aryl-alcohol dehydrogenase-like predicted oxidoreductase
MHGSFCILYVHMKNTTIGKTACYGVGIGTMPWSGSRFWGYGSTLKTEDARMAFDAAVAAGVDLFDTAEVYGFGKSEKAIGRILGDVGKDGIKIATKYAPMPWRLSSKSFRKALGKSLLRLGLDSVDLYQVHFPGGRMSIEVLMNAMADALDEGTIGAAGVSNYSAEDMKRAANVLLKRGHRLASNQVEYSLVHRSAEADGVLAACREIGATLIAYSPLGRGLLTGKYRPGQQPKDWRKHFSYFSEDKAGMVAPLIEGLENVADSHGKTPAQVAINWLARTPEVFPIPGAKNMEQARANAEAIGFEMTDAEASSLDELSAAFKVAKPFGRGGFRS